MTDDNDLPREIADGAQLFRWLGFAQTLQRGDELPPGVTRFRRENRWSKQVSPPTYSIIDELI
jgi:hypothetical protein